MCLEQEMTPGIQNTEATLKERAGLPPITAPSGSHSFKTVPASVGELRLSDYISAIEVRFNITVLM